mmetsp:Transcript_5214/g.10393  ORF Transcript_5214/g.10393 Transcript_5214/m.10393 type:complete len:1956 (+) Transcript_5214:214-6081(+)
MSKRKKNPSAKSRNAGYTGSLTGGASPQFPTLPPAPVGTVFWQCPGSSQPPRDVSQNPYRQLFNYDRYDRTLWNLSEQMLPQNWGIEFRPKGEKGFYKTYFCPRNRAWASLVKVKDFISKGCNYATLAVYTKPRDQTGLSLAPAKVTYRRFTNLDLGVFDTLPIEKMNEGTVDNLYTATVDFLRAYPQKMEVIKEGEQGGAESKKEAKKIIERCAKCDVYEIFKPNFALLLQEASEGKFGKNRKIGPEVGKQARIWEKRIERLGRKVTLIPKNALIVDWSMLMSRFRHHFPPLDTSVVKDKVVLKQFDKITRFMEELSNKQMMRDHEQEDRIRYLGMRMLLESNTLPAFQGEWRKIPYKERTYDHLRGYVVCDGLNKDDMTHAIEDMKTCLPTGFVGYNYILDEGGEGWMKEYGEGIRALEGGVDDDGKGNKDEDTRRAQVTSCIEAMKVNVEERVLNSMKVTEMDEIETNKTAKENWEVEEQAVWGIDCYTRGNIVESLPPNFTKEQIATFIDDYVLPTINSLPHSTAHSLLSTMNLLLYPSPTIHISTAHKTSFYHVKLGGKQPEFVARGAQWVKDAIELVGQDSFRVHPKGHGAVCLSPEGLERNRLVTFYRGEVYPSWRWSEKQDAITTVQRKVGIKPNLPDFYNMALERPRSDPEGFGLLFVDASRKASMGSSLSHSCNPTCEVKAVSKDGKLSLAMTTVRPVKYGEELTFDYGAVTDSIMEYQSAICLCGSLQCRGSFLHFSGAEQYQKILKKTHSIAVRFGKLLKHSVVPNFDGGLLKAHGFNTAAFGPVARGPNGESMDNVPGWLKGFVSEVLAYIEYERRALPLSLLCDSRDRAKAAALNGQPPPLQTCPQSPRKENKQESARIENTKEIPFEVADNEGRASMERRMLDLTQTLSLVGRVLSRHVRKKYKSLFSARSSPSKPLNAPTTIPEIQAPLRILSDKEVVQKLWTNRDSIVNRMYNSMVKAGIRPEDLALLKDCTRSFDTLKPENVKLLDDPVQAGKARKDVKLAMEKIREVLIYNLCKESKKTPFSWERHAAAADLLLFYQCTNHFIEVNGYSTFRADPVMVYARELGTKVERGMLAKAKKAINAKGNKVGEGDFINILVEQSLDVKRNGRDPLEHEEKKTKNKDDKNKPFEGFNSTSVGIKKKMKMFFETREYANKAGDLAKVFFLLSPDEETPEDFSFKVLTRQECEDMWAEYGEGNDAEDVRAKIKESRKGRATNNSSRAYYNYLRDFSINKFRFLEDLIRDYLTGNKKNIDEGLVDGEEGVAIVTKAYDKFYVLQQLLSWYKGGIDEETPAKAGKTTEASGGSEEKKAQTTGGLVSKDMTGCICLPDFTHLYTRVGDVNEEMVRYRERRKEYDALFAEWKAGRDLVEEKNARNLRIYEEELRVYQKQLADIENSKFREGKEIVAYPPPTQEHYDRYGENFNAVHDYTDEVESLPMGGSFAALGSGQMKFTLLPPKKPKMLHYRVQAPPEPPMPRDSFKYDSRNRAFLHKWISSDFDRNEPWALNLTNIFGVPNEKCIIGSPVLDFQISGHDTNLQTLIWYLGAGKNPHRKDENTSERDLVLNKTLENAKTKKQNFNWVQCENPQCMKWRRLPWHVDINTLPESFTCKDNIWEASKATCDAEEDMWDEAAEQTLNDANSVLTEKDIKVGLELDVYCEFKGKYAVGLVRKLDKEGFNSRALVEFRITSKHFEEEWVTIDNELTKFAPKNFYTKVRKKRAREEGEETEENAKKKNSQHASKEMSRMEKVAAATDHLMYGIVTTDSPAKTNEAESLDTDDFTNGTATAFAITDKRMITVTVTANGTKGDVGSVEKMDLVEAAKAVFEGMEKESMGVVKEIAMKEVDEETTGEVKIPEEPELSPPAPPPPPPEVHDKEENMTEIAPVVHQPPVLVPLLGVVAENTPHATATADKVKSEPVVEPDAVVETSQNDTMETLNFG